MKLNKTGLLILLAVVGVMALAILGRSYLQHVSEQKMLAQQLANAKTKLEGLQIDQLSWQKTQLEADLAQLNKQTNDTESRLFITNDSIAASSALIYTAKSSNVTILEISSARAAKDSTIGVSLLAMPVKVKVEGSMQNLLGFVYKLKERLPTAIVRDVKLSVQPFEASIGEEAGEGEQLESPGEVTPGSTTADVNLIIYIDSGEIM